MVSALGNEHYYTTLECLSDISYGTEWLRDKIKDIAHCLDEMRKAQKYISEESGASQV